MFFIIRDDDLNYFSQPADIERWYSDLFAQNIPIGFSTIPFVRGSSDVYVAAAQKEDKEYPITGNPALIAYVKGNPLIEILQHGTTHQTKDGAFEYARALPHGEALRGKEELTRAFGNAPRVFVPPHDWVGSDGIKAVETAGLGIIIRGRGAGLRNWLWRWQYAVIFVRMLWFKLFNPFAYPYVLDFGKHKEVCSYRLEDEDVFDGLQYAHDKNGVFVVVTHLHFYTDEKKARLRKLIEQARRLGAQFILPSALLESPLSTL